MDLMRSNVQTISLDTWSTLPMVLRGTVQQIAGSDGAANLPDIHGRPGVDEH